MKTAASLAALNTCGEYPAVVLACGIFDGVHRGHQRILERLCLAATAAAAVPVAVTFEPHPRAILHPHTAPARLMSLEQKLRLMEKIGVRGAVILPFSRELAALAPADFLQQHLLAAGIRLCGICIGAGWRFGAGGQGDTAFLQHFGEQHRFAVESIPELLYYGRPISSTRVRRAVSGGRMDLARRLLGRPYAIEGFVEHGKGMGGAEFACPTANVTHPGLLMPPCGVYAVDVVLDPEQTRGVEAKRMPGVGYIGTAPTVTHGRQEFDEQAVLEVHLFDYDGNLYGRRLEVEFLEYIRPDQVFPDIAALKEQMQKDIGKARSITSGRSELV